MKANPNPNPNPKQFTGFLSLYQLKSEGVSPWIVQTNIHYQ